MAVADKEEKAEEAPKKSKKKLFIILGVVVVLILGGAGAFFMLGGKKAEGEGEDEEEATAEGEHGEEGAEGGHGDAPGSIVALDPFIVNLQVKGSFLKSVIQLEFGDAGSAGSIDADMPKVRDAIIRTLSNKQAQDILNLEGKERLREEIKNAVNNAIGSEDVVNVFFTEFIVQ